MKSIKMLSVVFLFTILSSNAFAQLRLGAGLGFGFDQEAFALFGRAGYDFTENWRANATFQYFLLSNENKDFLDQDANSFNLHVNYDFANLPTIDLYALAGLSIFNYKSETLASKFSNTDLGLDVGVGGLFGIADKIDILSELKYDIGGADELQFTFGLMFNITGSR